ncbi:MAG: S9 family peptidase [Candidatus Eisenbacteria bacterium]|nr:S9 family peptidase [Candidatus Eisenbacteria bacterium]
MLSVSARRPGQCPALALSGLRRCFTLIAVSIAVFLAFHLSFPSSLLPPSASAQSHVSRPPHTSVRVVADTLHGVVIEDPYRWLEDQESPETRDWIDAQNAYTMSQLDRFPYRERVADRIGKILKVDRFTTPFERGGRYFFERRKADEEQFLIYVREGLAGKDRVLVDPRSLSADFTKSAGLMDVSLDGSLLAYSVRSGGEDEVEIRFLDVASGKDTGETMPHGNYFGLSISSDKKRCYYALQDDRGSLVLAHQFGSPVASDQEIFGRGFSPEKIVSAGLSEDGRYLLIQVNEGSSGKKDELYFVDLTQAEGKIQPIVTDIEANFVGQIGGDRLYLRTNWNAPHWRILAVDLARPQKENWTEVIPNGEAVLEDFSLVGGMIYANYLDQVKSRVRIFEADGRPAGEVAFPTLGSIGMFSGRWDGDEAFFDFESFHIPPTIYRYDTRTGTQEVWAQVHLPMETANVEVEQVWYPSKDGTRVPMFLVHQKGMKRDGDNPTLMYGYGGFTVSLTPYFSPGAAYWVEQGGLFAVPNLRGGGELGEDWHRAAMFEKKQNSFDDFIAAAEWLIANGYTNHSRLAITGGSNGGLLVGAVLTQRPDLCRAVICTYPLLDMIRFHKTLKGPYWVSEYGSSDDPEQFRYLLRYSPYHNIHASTPYPAVLFITGDADTRVDPMHARKMTAFLQAANSSPYPILLYYDTELGHSGGSPVSKQIEDQEIRYSFLFSQLGMEPKPVDE